MDESIDDLFSGAKAAKSKKEKKATTQSPDDKAARKAAKAKKHATDSTADDSLTESAVKDKKKKRSEVEIDEPEVKQSSKKSKLEKQGAVGKAQAVDEELPRRQRTRSLSNAEEVYPDTQSPEDFRKQHQITIQGTAENGSTPFACPPPMTSFDMTPFIPSIRRSLDAAGFPNPTPTQAQAWPIALQGRDVITVAKTGSGKTCGFLLPAFHRLLHNLKDRRRGPPGILVLAPTRELACQIEEECVKFGRSSNIRSTCAYGGAPKSLQVRKIQAGLEVLIATPGRLNDLLEMGVVKLNDVLFLVLDEADRM